MIKFSTFFALTFFSPTLIFFAFLGCHSNDGLSGNIHKQEKPEDKCAENMEIKKCRDAYTCFWNYDRCESKPNIKLPDLPQNLKTIKVKQLSVGKGICAIDENDQLWCLSKSTAFPTVLPHPNYRFKQVATTFPDTTEEGHKVHVCAIQTDGKSICFKEKHYVPFNGPTDEKAIKIVPMPYKKTICAITEKGKISCTSEEPMFDNDKFENYKLTDLPAGSAIKEIFLYRKFLFASNTDEYEFGILTTANIIYTANVDLGKWVRNDRYQNIKSASAWERSLCWSEQGKPGIICPDIWLDNNQPAFLENPAAAVKGTEFTDISITDKYACGIAKGNNIICWGNPEIEKNLIPALVNAKGKSISLSQDFMCYIDLDDYLSCLKIFTK